MAKVNLLPIMRRPEVAAPRRSGGFRLSVLAAPAGLVLGFGLLLAILFGGRLLPAREVSLTTVVTLPADPDAGPSTPAPAADPFEAPVAFQASGWIEPDPQPTKVTALVNGVVDKVFALEGQTVQAGEVLATLIDDDAKLDLETARARLRTAEAQRQGVRAAVRANRAERESLQARIRSAEALLAFRQSAAERFAGAGRDAVTEIDIEERRELAAAQAAEVAALQAGIAAVDARQSELAARGAEAEAALAAARTEVARRELALSRTRITSPLDGRVMRLLVTPGQQRMLGPDNRDSAAIAYLYDPDSLQARIDVPLAEAARVHPGQAVRLRTNFLPDAVFRGRVTRITGEADIQRNTLQAKVEVLQPDDRLRPEMLCRAEFLASGPANGEATAPASAASTPTASTSAAPTLMDGASPVGAAVTRGSAAGVRLFAPEAALVDRDGDAAHVWRLDASGERVQWQAVTLGNTLREGYRRVLDGLRPGDRIVLNPPEGLQPGERVRARAEDNSNLKSL